MLGGRFMSSIEIEAKTTQEAIERACKHFHLDEEELDIEVLESRSTGIFGVVGNKKVKIRVTPKKDTCIVLAQETLKKMISLISADTKISAEKKGDDIILNIE
jgi:spoIIIJ-associated protein